MDLSEEYLEDLLHEACANAGETIPASVKGVTLQAFARKIRALALQEAIDALPFGSIAAASAIRKIM